jgi:hypothetical protein
MQMQVNKKWIFLFIGLMLATTFYLFINDFEMTESGYPASLESTQSKVQTAINSKVTSPVSHEENAAQGLPNIDTSNYLQCEGFYSDYYSANRAWKRYVNGHKLLEAGYSLNEISNGLHHINQTINFSIIFRLEVLRKNSELVRNNELLNNAIKSHIPEFVEAIKALNETLNEKIKETSTRVNSISGTNSAAGFSAYREIPVPLTILEGLSQKPESEQRKILTIQAPRVDDVAYFINNKDTSNEVILLMLEYLKDPSQIVGYSGIDSISLLDFAANASRLSVVETLLAKGLVATEDEYLLSSLEFALKGLERNFDTEREEDAVAIVRLFENMGGSARFKSQTVTTVESQNMRSDFRFRKDEIETLQVKYGFDLTTISNRPLVVSNPNAPLVSKLDAFKVDFINTRLSVDDFEMILDECKKTLSGRNERWKPIRAATFVDAYIKETSLDKSEIEKQLAAIHPLLVDTYRMKVTSSRLASNKMKYRIGTWKENTNIQEFIEKVLAKQPTRESLNSAFLLALSEDQRVLTDLINSSLFTGDKIYKGLTKFPIRTDMIETLQKAGLDLKDVDVYNKTFLFYAGQSKSAALLDYLRNKKFPFSKDELGEDPLHQVLKMAIYNNSLPQLLPKVDVMMSYKPEIDEFHLQYMAAIKHFYTDSYEGIIEKYPALTINENTALPPYQ